MKVGDILKNITEIQNPNWVKLMNDDDLNAFKLDSAMKMVAGTARSMGIRVKGAFPELKND